MKKTNHIDKINNIIYVTLNVYFKQDRIKFLKIRVALNKQKVKIIIKRNIICTNGS